MITVCEKGKCTGCMECIDICPKGAIQVVDSMIEYNAIIDLENALIAMLAIKRVKIITN